MLPIRPVPVNNSRARRDRIQRHGTPSAGTACDPAEAAGSGRADKAPSPAARAAFSASCFENSCGHPPPGWVGSSNKPLLCKTGQSRSFLPEPGAPRRRAGPRAERRPRPRRRGGSGTSLPPGGGTAASARGAPPPAPGPRRKRRPAMGRPWGRWLLPLGLLQLLGGPAAGACPCQDPRLCHPVTGTGGFEVRGSRRLSARPGGSGRPGRAARERRGAAGRRGRPVPGRPARLAGC